MLFKKVKSENLILQSNEINLVQKFASIGVFFVLIGTIILSAIAPKIHADEVQNPTEIPSVSSESLAPTNSGDKIDKNLLSKIDKPDFKEVEVNLVLNNSGVTNQAKFENIGSTIQSVIDTNNINPENIPDDFLRTEDFSNYKASRKEKENAFKVKYENRFKNYFSSDFISQVVSVKVDKNTLQDLIRDDQVVSIKENQYFKPSVNEMGDQQTGSYAVHDMGYSGNNNIVAVLDTGFETSHEMLQGRIFDEACFSSNYSCAGNNSQVLGSGASAIYPSYYSGFDHGTHVAGIIAGNKVTYNGQPLAGIATKSKLLAINIFNKYEDNISCGGYAPCLLASSANIQSGLDYVRYYKAVKSPSSKIVSVNMSLGGGGYGSSCDYIDNTSYNLVNSLNTLGINVVVAAGNDGYADQISYPGCLSNVISVGSVDSDNGVSYFSNSANFLSMLAPGGGIVSSIPGNSYAYFQGTSMAAPQVAGAIAVLKEANPSLTAAQVKNILITSGYPVYDTKNDITKNALDLYKSIFSNACPSNQLLASYYNNTSLTGYAATSACENFNTTAGNTASIVKNWYTASPIIGVNPDNWSSRYTGKINVAVAGNYRFTSTVALNDASKFYINDLINPLINS